MSKNRSNKSFKELDKGGLDLANMISASMESDVEEEVLTFNKLESDTNVKLLDLDLISDAPEDWNFFSPLIDAKFQTMKESIAEDGLFHPILVWEVEEGKNYMILSGHNRRRAFQELLDESGEDRFKKISAKIIRSRSMTKEKAKAVVSMANYAQRNVNPTEEFEALKSIFIYNKEELNIQKKAENYSHIEQTTGKDLSSIKRILNLSRLIPELFNMIGGDKPISIVAAQRLITLSEEDQHWLYDNFKDKLNSKNVSKIRKFMERDRLIELFDDEPIEMAEGISMFIPKILEKDVKMLIKEWERNNNSSWNLNVDK